jgi:putative radical SAM enzyme (TIGR03279 family)
LKHKSIVVREVTPGSIAEEAGIQSGDKILFINNEKIGDIFDYRFLVSEESLVIEIQKVDGELWEVEIEKDQYEDLGIEFDSSMLDEAKSCTNKCVFCFIDQLPEGMRETLYFKDDDSRLSFLTGNYVTLTNMDKEDIYRIIRYRMSPINVSVHTTNPGLRVRMLNNKFAGDVLDKIKILVNGGIKVNCQIVLCKEINDEAELDNTISDLAYLYPGVSSISVVPVGITRHRKGLYYLKPYDRKSANAVVLQVERWQKKLLEEFGSRIVYLADELYIMAQHELPGYDYYEDFPQLENGVGLVSLLRYEFYEYLDEAREYSIDKLRHTSIATGVSAFRFIREMAQELEGRYKGLKINVYEIKNKFFGENVTVAGLLTGGDIASQLAGKDLGEELLISRSMLKSGEQLFLDDTTIPVLESILKVKIGIVENSGKDFIDKLLGRGGMDG